MLQKISASGKHGNEVTDGRGDEFENGDEGDGRQAREEGDATRKESLQELKKMLEVTVSCGMLPHRTFDACSVIQFRLHISWQFQAILQTKF